MFPMNLGPMEIGIILLLGVIVFGKKLPEIGRSVGRSIVEFKKGFRDDPDWGEKKNVATDPDRE